MDAAIDPVSIHFIASRRALSTQYTQEGPRTTNIEVLGEEIFLQTTTQCWKARVAKTFKSLGLKKNVKKFIWAFVTGHS